MMLIQYICFKDVISLSVRFKKKTKSTLTE